MKLSMKKLKRMLADGTQPSVFSSLSASNRYRFINDVISFGGNIEAVFFDDTVDYQNFLDNTSNLVKKKGKLIGITKGTTYRFKCDNGLVYSYCIIFKITLD